MARWMKTLAIGMFRFVDNDVSLELLPNANYAIIFNAILLWGMEDYKKFKIRMMNFQDPSHEFNYSLKENYTLPYITLLDFVEYPYYSKKLICI